MGKGVTGLLRFRSRGSRSGSVGPSGLKFGIVRLDPLFQRWHVLEPDDVVLVPEHVHAKRDAMAVFGGIQLGPIVREVFYEILTVRACISQAKTLVVRVRRFR